MWRRRTNATSRAPHALSRVSPRPATRLALRHTGAWRTDWGGRRTVLRSDVWRVHVRAFADALGKAAADTKSHPALIPLLKKAQS